MIKMYYSDFCLLNPIATHTKKTLFNPSNYLCLSQSCKMSTLSHIRGDFKKKRLRFIFVNEEIEAEM